jgi:branched-chain amino acid aminotransferase
MKKAQLWKINLDNKSLPIMISDYPSFEFAMKKLPEGVYTTFRTYMGDKVLRIESHFKRLEESAYLAGTNLNISWGQVRLGVHSVIQNYPSDEKRIRLLIDLTEKPEHVFLLVEALSIPSAVEYQHGIDVCTTRLERTNPKAKLTSFIKQSQQIRKGNLQKCYEVILIGEDDILLEGLSSNFFAIKDDQLWTEDKRVLSGITRQIVLDIAVSEAFPVKLTGISRAELSGISEAFLTSVSRGILPIRKIDQWVIGDGEPGLITRKLMTFFREKIECELEQI